MDREQLKRNIRSFGLAKTMEDIVLRGVNRVCVLKILKGVRVESVNPEFLKCDERYRSQFLDQDALREFSKNPEYELSPRFLDEALEKGDSCYAILDGSRLAAYGWYSNRPTAIDLPGLVLHFDPRYVYMYKGFTHDDYRGQRLHAVGMTRALAAYLESGYKGIISYVEYNNYASLRSCYRMGYQDFGEAYAFGFAGQFLLHSSPGCRQYAFGLRRDASPRNGQAFHLGR